MVYIYYRLQRHGEAYEANHGEDGLDRVQAIAN